MRNLSMTNVYKRNGKCNYKINDNDTVKLVANNKYWINNETT